MAQTRQQPSLIFTGCFMCTTVHCQGVMYSMFSLQHIIVHKQTMFALSGSGCLVFLCSILLSFPAALKAPLVFLPRMMPVFSSLIWLQQSHFKFKCSLTLKLFFSLCLSVCLFKAQMQKHLISWLSLSSNRRQRCAGLEEQARVCYFYRASLRSSLP